MQRELCAIRHLPADKKGFPVVAITDLDKGQAEGVAKDFGIPKVLAGVQAAPYAQGNAVFDIAVPAALCGYCPGTSSLHSRRRVLCSGRELRERCGQMGVNLNYPVGRPDTLRYIIGGDEE